MWNILNKKTYSIKIFRPCKGRVIDLESVNDPVFSQKMIGDGFAIIPSDGTFVSPIKGKISYISSNNNSYRITSDEGLDVFFHIGIGTYKLNNSIFKPIVKVGQNIEIGDVILRCNLEDIKTKTSIITPVVITDDDFKIVYRNKDARIDEFVLEVSNKN